ncbi:MAG TPA: type II toxin-antitoxin system RelE/ParE family toxin [Clostridiales bacterium]|nr:type II toxin-antitoxin system RelE/ParE family toxin [Clostridiales bacterium]
MTTTDYSAVILPQAEQDITEILDYIAVNLKNPSAAKNLWTDIKEAIARAKAFPYAMPTLKNEKITLGKEYRRLDVNNYVLIYKVNECKKEICIFAVFYAPSNVIAKVLNRI